MRTSIDKPEAVRDFVEDRLPGRCELEMEAEFGGVRTRRHKMRAAERGQEVVQCFLIGQIDDREPGTPAKAVAMEEIVVANRHVEKISGLNTRWIGVVVLCSGSWYADTRRPRFCGISPATGSGAAQRRKQAGLKHLPPGGHAKEPDRGLLVSIECQRRRKVRYRSGHQPAVIAPVETDPRSALPWLVLQVRGLVELFVMVDAKRRSVLANRYAQAAHLRRKVARGNSGHYDQRREAVKIWDAHTHRVARNF